MRPLIWHYMLCANVRRTPILYVIPILVGIIMWPRGEHPGDGTVDATMLRVSYMLVFMSAMGMAFLATAGSWPIREYGLSLPANRRTLFVAQTTACMLMIGVFTVPLILVAGASTRISELHPRLWVFGTNITLAAMAAVLIAVPLDRLLCRRSAILRLIGSLVVLTPGLATVFFLVMSDRADLAPAAVAVVVGAVAWFLGMRQFERHELVPTPPREPAPAWRGSLSLVRPSALDALSPSVRVMTLSMWLEWRYLLLVGYLIWMEYLAVAGMDDAGLAIVLGVFGSVFFPVFATGLLPHVPRLAVFRCFYVPLLVGTLLTAFVAAVQADSAERILMGLLSVFCITFAAWVNVPFVFEYRRARRVTSRHVFWGLVGLVIVAPGIPGLRLVTRHLAAWVRDLDWPPLLLDPWFQALLLMVGTIAFWRLAERKFRHYEPEALPRGAAAEA